MFNVASSVLNHICPSTGPTGGDELASANVPSTPSVPLRPSAPLGPLTVTHWELVPSS